MAAARPSPAAADPRHAIPDADRARPLTMISPVKLAVLAASPMYYQVPLYRRLAAQTDIDFSAIFMSNGGVRPHDAGFGQDVVWDVDLLSGYSSTFLRRSTHNPIDGGPLTFRDFDVVRHLRRRPCDVLWVHGYNSLTHVLATITQRALGGAVLFREEQTLLHQRSRVNLLAKRATLKPLLRLGRGLYIGSESRAWFMAHGMPSHRLFLVPYVVDNDRLRRSALEYSPDRAHHRARFGIIDDSPVVLSVSRLIPKKQPLFLLDAFRRVRERARCHLLVVGTGELEGRMRSAVAAQRIPDVHFAGFLNQSEIGRAYACADIFTLPSLVHETWGLVVNEAMNFGLPVVVSSAVGSASDLVVDGKNGFVTSPDNAQELADRLLALVLSPDKRQLFGSASFERITPWNYDAGVQGIRHAIAASLGPTRFAA